MKAAFNDVYGPPEVVSIEEVEDPVPGPDEILVRVCATTVNRTDCGFRSAEYFISRLFSGLFKPRNPVLGCEFAGEVERVGHKVTRFSIGDKVFGFDDKAFGGHAEYKTIAEDAAVSTVPSGFSFSRAAPLLEGSHYALCNIRAAKVEKGQNVMVYGATGAIGSSAVQLLKHLGVTVTAVGNTVNMDLLGLLGADRIRDHQKEDLTDTDQRFDLILDAVGKSSFWQCKPLLKDKGIYISTELGKHSENIGLALVTPLFAKKKVLFPIPRIDRHDVQFIRALAEKGEFHPVIDSSYPLDRIVEAHEYVEKGQKTGNVVITVSDGMIRRGKKTAITAPYLPQEF